MTLNSGEHDAEVRSEWHGFWRWARNPRLGLEVAVHWRGRSSKYLRTMNLRRTVREGVWVWMERSIALTQLPVDDEIDDAILVWQQGR